MHASRAILLALIFFRFLKINPRAKRFNSVSTGPIFTKFLPYGRYLIVDYRFDPFAMAQRMLPWQPILGSKLAKNSDYSPLFVALAFRNKLQYRQSDF